MNQALANILIVLRERKYFLLFSFSSFLSFIVLSLLTLATTTNFSPGIFVMMNGRSYALITLLLFILLSLLSGIYLAMLFFRSAGISRGRKHHLTSLSGFFVGFFSTGCPMCGAFLLGLLGFPLALFYLPFKGLELRFLSFFLLLTGVYLIAKNIHRCEGCR